MYTGIQSIHVLSDYLYTIEGCFFSVCTCTCIYGLSMYMYTAYAYTCTCVYVHVYVHVIIYKDEVTTHQYMGW